MSEVLALGDVADVVAGVGFPKDMQGGQVGAIPVFKVGDISAAWLQGKSLLNDSRNYLSVEEAKSLGKCVAAGATVFAKIGEALRLNRRVMLGRDALVDNNVMGLVPKREKVAPKYLYYFMQTVDLGELSRSTTVPSIRKSDVVEISIPVPALVAQDEIVAELEKQFSRLDEAVANLQRVKANLKRYKASVLKAAVEGRLVETEDDWTRAKLGDIALSVRNGYSSKPDADSGTRIFRISAVRPMELTVDDVRYLSGAPADYGTFLTEEGDVLFTRYNGSRDYVGVCAQVPTGLPPTVYPDKLIRVRVPTDQLLPAFLVISASTGEGREFIESMIRTTAGQSGVSGSDIKAIPLSIPTMAEQTRIVAEVDRHLSIIREVEAEVDANLQRAQALRQATLATAFGLNSTP